MIGPLIPSYCYFDEGGRYLESKFLTSSFATLILLAAVGFGWTLDVAVVVVDEEGILLFFIIIYWALGLLPKPLDLTPDAKDAD